MARLADFGYSTKAGPDTLVKLPNSVHWTAPERTHRPVTTLAAKKMDVFSFALLCLWTLAGKDPSNDTWLRNRPLYGSAGLGIPSSSRDFYHREESVGLS